MTNMEKCQKDNCRKPSSDADWQQKTTHFIARHNDA